MIPGTRLNVSIYAVKPPIQRSHKDLSFFLGNLCRRVQGTEFFKQAEEVAVGKELSILSFPQFYIRQQQLKADSKTALMDCAKHDPRDLLTFGTERPAPSDLFCSLFALILVQLAPGALHY